MNAFGFISLLRRIYGKKKPDLEWIQGQGLLAVKIAQHYALRVDFLDEGVCRHLSQLFGQAQSVDAQSIRDVLDRSVEADWYDTIQGFEDKPIAAASIGQVHLAKYQGVKPVVVKVIKGDFRESFLKDLHKVRQLMQVLLFFYPKLRKVFDPLAVLAHIEEYTINELDLRNEIAGQVTLREIAREYEGRYDLSRLSFPEMYSDFSSCDVLVSDFVQGRTFDDLLEHGELSYENLLALFSIHGLYLFAPGIFHGDLHPGNVMLADTGDIVFLDTGAVSQVGDKIRRGLFRFFLALSDYDYPSSARRINEMAEKGIEGKAFADFEKKFLALYDDFAGRTVSEISLTRKMMESIKLAVNCGMEFEKGMFAIIKSMMYLDGMVLRCKPDAVLLKDMRPFIKGFEKVLEGGQP